MNSETVITEAPNWLSELEAKREQRLKARLGHETGAGAPCLTCEKKCPGLDLHFWRKICKICKCSKENHDVHDDDIYGWAQFQLLGSKPNKIKRKIVLPGKKDEVELEWSPKGQNDTVEKYLKTIPTELLPVKGSKAAQNRKQLLQKQIPIHDIDPSLCHELSDLELKQFHDYIDYMKQNSVGIGHVVQANALFLSDRYPKVLPTMMETVKLQNQNSPATKLTKPFEQMKISTLPTGVEGLEGEGVPMIPGVISSSEKTGRGSIGAGEGGLMHGNNNNRPEEIEREPVKLGIKNLNYPSCNTSMMKELNEFFDTIPKPVNMVDNRRNNLPHYAQNHLNLFNDNQTPSSFGGIKDLAFSTFEPSLIQENNNPIPTNTTNTFNNNNNSNRKLQSFNPVNNPQLREDNLVPSQIQIGAVRDINYYQNIEPEIKAALQQTQPSFLPNDFDNNEIKATSQPPPTTCQRCKKLFKADDEFGIYVERSKQLYHTTCFKCYGCNQNLADMMYFYDKESDNIYCGRDYAKIRGIPRCNACDELIFLKEYCLAENSTYHIKHFCCFLCDQALAGKNYIIDDDNNKQPLCLPCFELNKANKCNGCMQLIKPDEQGANLNGVHFHANNQCFSCFKCNKPLLGEKLLLRNEKLFCSHACFQSI